MSNAQDLHLPLSDSELDELDNLLEKYAVPHNGMSLEMLDGFLTAIISGPENVPPAEWINYIWQLDGEGATPAWETAEQLTHFMTLVSRHSNGIIGTLTNDLDNFSPLMFDFEGEDGKNEIHAQEWCLGYARGIDLRADDWAALLDDPDFSDDYAAVEILAFGPGDEKLAHLLENQEQRDELIESATDFAMDAHEWWQKQRASHQPKHSDHPRLN